MRRVRFLLPGAAGVALLAGAATGASLAAFSAETSNSGNTFSAAATFVSCPSPPSAIRLTGFEYGLLTTNGNLFTSTPGAPKIDSMVKRTGDYSLRVEPASNSEFAELDFPSSATVVARFAIRLTTLPSDNARFVRWVPDLGTPALFTYDVLTGKFAARFGAGLAAVGTVTASVGTWHVVDMRISFGTNPRTIDWRVDGVAQPQALYAESGSTGFSVQLGPNTMSSTYKANFDDLIVSATSTDYPIGAGRVLPLRPAAMGTHNAPGNFQNDDGSAVDAASYSRVDDNPLTSAADYVLQAATSATSYVELGFADTAEACVNAVSGVVAYHSPATQTNAGRTSLFDGSTDTVVYSGDMSETSLWYAQKVVAPASPWTPAAVNGLVGRIGYSSDASPTPYWDALLLEVDVPS